MMSQNQFTFVFLHSLILLYQCSLQAHAASVCYGQDGNATDDNVPCDTSAPSSPCCGQNDTCLFNGLCKVFNPNNNTVYAEGTCSDRTWPSSLCPKLCPGKESCIDNAIDLFFADEVINYRAGLFGIPMSRKQMVLPCRTLR